MKTTPRNHKGQSNSNAKRGHQKRRNNASKKNAKVSKLDPRLLVKKATSREEVEFQSSTLFSSLPVSEQLKKNLEKKGYEALTKIQEQSILPLLEKRDLMGISSTGSGKTCAFLIPIIHHALENPKGFKALIVAPTRELALQIEEEFKSLTIGMNMSSATFIGGTNINTDEKKLRKHPQIVVGTPGRLLDLYGRRLLKLQWMKTLVLDEFDRMLDMGFVNDVKKLVAPMKERSQTMLFSATLDQNQKSLIDNLLNDPVEVKVNSGGHSSDNVNQEVIYLKEGEEKFLVLQRLLEKPELEKVILFTETKRLADRVSKKLNQVGISSGLIHGNKSQNFRNRMIDEFKIGKTKVLVATDVAARGIDVADVTHVINYQLPMSMDSYIHRIGRTGRAGKTGQAITFVN